MKYFPADVPNGSKETGFVCRRASGLETRPAQFLCVVLTDGLGAAAVNCPNGNDAFSSSSRKAVACGNRRARTSSTCRAQTPSLYSRSDRTPSPITKVMHPEMYVICLS